MNILFNKENVSISMEHKGNSLFQFVVSDKDKKTTFKLSRQELLKAMSFLESKSGIYHHHHESSEGIVKEIEDLVKRLERIEKKEEEKIEKKEKKEEEKKEEKKEVPKKVPEKKSDKSKHCGKSRR